MQVAAQTGTPNAYQSLLLQLIIVLDLSGICNKPSKRVSSGVESPGCIRVLLREPLKHVTHVLICLFNNVNVMVWILSELVVAPGIRRQFLFTITATVPFFA